MRQCVSHATVAGIAAPASQPATLDLYHTGTFWPSAEACGAVEPSNHCPCRGEQPFPIGQASTRLLTPASPSLPIGGPELVRSGISGGIQQRDLGQSFSIPFPLWLPAPAALPLLVIVRGVLGRQWAIQ